MKLTFVLFIWLLGGSALATTVFYGPVPYQKRADSPFYAGIQSGDIYVEDFEGPTLKTPNVSYMSGEFARLSGVDEDDGVLDSRSNGSIWYSVSSVIGFEPSFLHVIHFQPDSKGGYPRYVGFAFLGFVRESVLEDPFYYYNFIDSNNNQLSDQPINYLLPRLPDETRDFSTVGSQFVGVFSETGIKSILIGRATRIDHLQYGWSIPEASSVLLILVSVPILAIRRRRVDI